MQYIAARQPHSSRTTNRSCRRALPRRLPRAARATRAWPGGSLDSVAPALTVIMVVAASEGLGWVARRLGQPKVLGELATGLVLGASLLGVLNPHEPTIAALGEIGLLVLLFEIGLETDIAALVRVGGAATVVGLVGVALPLLLGSGCALLFGLTWLEALLCGASLTATSIGISARVLQQLGWIRSTEGRVVLGAAVLDDIVGLALLALITLIAGSVTSRGHGGHQSPLASVALLVAFALGMALHRTRWRRPTERGVRVLGFVVVPMFFAVVGAGVQLRAIGGAWPLGLAVSLLVAGVVGKFAAAYAPRGFRGNRAIVGLAMVPRGEVGLVFASTASVLGVFDQTLFSIVTLVVMATTFLAPPMLARVIRRAAETHGD